MDNFADDIFLCATNDGRFYEIAMMIVRGDVRQNALTLNLWRNMAHRAKRLYLKDVPDDPRALSRSAQEQLALRLADYFHERAEEAHRLLRREAQAFANASKILAV